MDAYERTRFPCEQYIAVAFGNGVFVAIDTAGVSNHYETSPDGITWTDSRIYAHFVSGQLFFTGPIHRRRRRCR